MTDNRPPRPGGSFAKLLKIGGLMLMLSTALLLCFCSLLPAALFLSFVFNALIVGSSLFATMAQEREKRTIDALRLTQLSSLDILLLKSRRELGRWTKGNLALFAIVVGSAVIGDEPLIWALSGALVLAAGGLLSMALALAVSTRSETTSSAVVSGWVVKGAWLVGLPLLDQVLQAVLVLDRPLHFFRFLDPAWVALQVAEASFFEVGGMTLAGLGIGGVATVVVAGLAVLGSSRLIDTSFEAAANLDDRSRHSAYTRKFAWGLDENPFFVREMAWQMRSGAGRWPGYAVFLTLFLAPFLYGLAQHQKGHESEPLKIVRRDLTSATVAPATIASTMSASQAYGSESGATVEGGGCEVAAPSCRGSSACEFQASCGADTATVEPTARPHGGFCLSRMMGLPVDSGSLYQDQIGYRSVVTSTGRVERVSEDVIARLQSDELSPGGKDRSGAPLPSWTAEGGRSAFEFEMGRGLLTGLLLTVIYLFVRGGAFMASSVTGEKERRAWDQIALTGVAPETFVVGKLAAVLAFPLRQMLVASPALGLFALAGVVTWTELLLVIALLTGCFLAAGALGMATSVLRPTSHAAQGAALCVTAGLLLLPMSPLGWLVLIGGLMLLLAKTALTSAERLIAYTGILASAMVGGAAVSPIASVMALCGSAVGQSSMVYAIAGTGGMLLWSALSMTALAGFFLLVAVRSLNKGGSVESE